ncbi:hypothetical protein FE407_08040 [Leuconostoc carnosum]|uniref:nitroreductase family protein n=1 Tax=Leuconostoc TaxID=1243 RepID=UPI000D51220A|nr:MULTISPECIES: nitroreductase family protein [Leuconostoc]KAA8324537.1 hypothetical protein FE404_07555 [Leuconostoc carnosum]KAA8358210.1 hypothetical protein FE407_08040 [Leuconostoc carnosum]KAA8364708.1 hypothetical protein FE406_08035 [Leuconostoc carnosum]KAA8365581.1 hypothetical protein FE416_08345 [Leuconostoc carnosum]KAA8371609.1 hypothetical protein FE415_08535 [Leuconostoc carnosum]
MKETFLNLQNKRHTVLNITDNVDYSNDHLQAIINKTISLSPTAFNNKSVKTILLTDQHNISFWKQVLTDKLISKREHSKKNDQISYQNLNFFSRGKGTILFFTDDSVITEKQNYSDMFNWCEQNHAIAEYSVWLMLTELDLGASLQHCVFHLSKKCVKNSIYLRHGF